MKDHEATLFCVVKTTPFSLDLHELRIAGMRFQRADPSNRPYPTDPTLSRPGTSGPQP